VPGKPGDYVDEFEGAQAYADLGVVEWVGEKRAVLVETTDAPPADEAAVARPSPRTRTRRGVEVHGT
jgi:hypothetical protein